MCLDAIVATSFKVTETEQRYSEVTKTEESELWPETFRRVKYELASCENENIIALGRPHIFGTSSDRLEALLCVSRSPAFYNQCVA